MKEQNQREAISARYNSEPLFMIENEIKSLNGYAADAIKSMVERLFYLDFSKRYREDSAHKKSSFKTYMEAKFGISDAQYQLWRTAYAQFSEDVEAHGIGFVADTVKACGSVKKTRAALDKVRVRAHMRSKPLLHSEKKALVDEFVTANAKPKQQETAPAIDWKSRHDELQVRYVTLQEEYKTLSEQHQRSLAMISSLRKTIDDARSYQNAIVNTLSKPSVSATA